MPFLLLIVIVGNPCLQTAHFQRRAWLTSAFRFPCLTWAMGARGICLRISLYLQPSHWRLRFVDLHTKLTWRAAALKFHLLLSFAVTCIVKLRRWFCRALRAVARTAGPVRSAVTRLRGACQWVAGSVFGALSSALPSSYPCLF